MIRDNLPTLRVVVLAAGFSQRLGTPKALVRVRGLGLLQRTLAVLEPLATAPIIVVVPPRAARYRVACEARRTTWVVNHGRAGGLSSSVRRGLEAVRYSSAVLLLPVDLAELRRTDVARLIARWQGSRRAVIARRGGDGAATPLILPRRLYAAGLDITGDQGLRGLVRRLDAAALLVDMPSAELDVDTAHDLDRVRRHRCPRQFLASCTKR
jgi:CTP:molybdopterin cytidylyltransferase MocA